MSEHKKTLAPVGAGVEGQDNQFSEYQHSTAAQSHTIALTVWRNKSGTQRSELNKTWPEICNWLSDLPPVAVKDDCQLIKFARFGDERTENGALRHDANVIEITGIEGDYDDEEMAPEQAIALMEKAGLRAAVAPTFTSTPEKPRWRVLTPLVGAVSPSERLKYLEALNGILGGVLAKESATLSQSYYIGVPAGAVYTVINTFGDPEQGATLDGLEMMDGIDHLRMPVKGKGAKAKDSTGPGRDNLFDESEFEDWVEDVVSCEAIHPALVRIVAHCVAKDFDDKHIRMLFLGLADRVSAKRGPERADLMLGKELDEAIKSARQKGFAPASYADVMAEAQALTRDSDPAIIEALVEKVVELKPIQKRRVHEVIKKQTGLPFSAMEAAERSKVDEDDDDDLALAQGLANEIGRDNVIAAQAFVWRWIDTGVWQKQEDRSVKQWAQRYMSAKVESVKKSNVESVTDLFKTEVFKPDQQFDIGPPECVNTLNGELALVEGNWQLHPHDREHYRTTQVPVEYDPDATAPKFEKFLADVFNGDADTKEKKQALLEMIGYSLMAHCRHEKFIILVGSGANGKSVLLSVLEGLLGSGNVAGVQPSQFDRSFQRAHLHGKLANIVTEIKQGEMIDDASLKGIVSGEPTTVEHKFKNPFDMRPFSTCWFGTNHMPHTRDFSDALFRRALVVEFNNKFKPEMGNCDPQLKDKLLDELPGILNLALKTYAEALLSGFTMPASCQEARERWRLEADQVAQFVEAECEATQGERIPPLRLFNAYRDWADENGIQKKLTQRSFLDRLVALGYERQRTGASRYICGLKCERIYSAFERV
ncbi:MAG: phage/plasmid primase, P4 family [Halomonas sp.]|uniref:DNA primase family protein n=1 Tax=Halomonas sp. TaxID=1486246 RepID=UPI002ACDBB6E|nr:phage/plasmid primase, P4 family [Halomonas sp.]MDZ7852943.1 phage/plasmid primase, P4 family [Halomonas sp.]